MLTNDLEHERRKKCKSHGKLTSLIKFVRKGEKPSRTTNNFLQIAWEMKVDLGGRLQFPQIIQTTLRPDLDLWSEERTKIILTELTVPWEEGGDQALKKKECQIPRSLATMTEKGWQVWLFPVEVD